jgi:hypothetical protein
MATQTFTADIFDILDNVLDWRYGEKFQDFMCALKPDQIKTMYYAVTELNANSSEFITKSPDTFEKYTLKLAREFRKDRSKTHLLFAYKASQRIEMGYGR